MIKPRPPLPVLTSLRFFAAMEVLLFHYRDGWGLLLDSVASEFITELFEAGYQAVTFFFVLSGFILTYGYAGHSEAELFIVRGHEFLKSRLARIYPTYFLALCIPLSIFVYGTFVWKIQSLGVFVGGLMLSPLLLQAWVPAMAVAWNVPSWSLSVE